MSTVVEWPRVKRSQNRSTESAEVYQESGSKSRLNTHTADENESWKNGSAVFGYCNKPSLGPWTRSPGTVPPSSCRYINSGAIIGVCAFSQSPLGPAAAPLSYSFYLCRFPLRLPLALSFLLFLSLCPLSLSLSLSPPSLAHVILSLPPFPLSSSSSFSSSSSSFSSSSSSSILCLHLLVAHPLTRPPCPFAYPFSTSLPILTPPLRLVCFPFASSSVC